MTIIRPLAAHVDYDGGLGGWYLAHLLGLFPGD